MWSFFRILWLWQNGLFVYEYYRNTPLVNANQLGYLQWCMVTWPCIIAVMHGHMTVHHFWMMHCHVTEWCMVDCQHVHHLIMMNIKWWHFNQSAKQLIVGHITATNIVTNDPGIVSLQWSSMSSARVVVFFMSLAISFLSLSLPEWG